VAEMTRPWSAGWPDQVMPDHAARAVADAGPAAALAPAGPGAPDQPELTVPYPRVLRTDDPWEARARTQEFLNCSHRMTVLDRDTPFLAEVQHRSIAGLGLLSSGYGPAVEIACSPPVAMITVNFVAGGAMLIEDGSRGTVADRRHGAVFCFHDELRMRWSPGLRQLMLTIDKTRIERYLQALLDEPVRRPVRFESRLDLAGAGQGLAAAVLTLRRALQRCGPAGPSPVLAAEIEHGILTTLLLGQRHNYTDAIFSVRALPPPRVVRRVVELIDSVPQTAFTVADLAEFAGVSERSLHTAFRRQFGISPMSYLRRRRLEHAHDELLRLDPAGARVTDVALRYGFTHPGRFAAIYRAHFGESPSTTLRR
jgi:AraC-like DNA-binding protein